MHSTALGTPGATRRSPTLAFLVAGLLVTVLPACSEQSEDVLATAGNSTSQAQEAPGAQGERASSNRGTIKEKVAAPAEGRVTVGRDVGISEAAVMQDGLVVRVNSVEQGQAQAIAPGDIEGPALIIGIVVRNGSPDPVDLDSSSVTLVDSEDQVAIPVTEDRTRPLSGVIEPGGVGRGTYVFRTPPDTRKSAIILVSTSAGTPVAKFTGDVRK